MSAYLNRQIPGMFGKAMRGDVLKLCTIRPAPRWHCWYVVRLFLATMLVWTAAGCTATFLSAYDNQSIERTTEISKGILALYQQIISTEPQKRASAVKGPLNATYGDIETQIRVHLLREQGRAKNSEGTTVATNLLGSWQKFSANHRSSDSTALTNATLDIERDILQRHLRAAFVAEESKKLVGGTDK